MKQRNPFESYNPLDLSNYRPPTPEHLDVKFLLAKPENWEECKSLRIAALESGDAEMVASTPEVVDKEKNKSEEVWRTELSDPDKFTVLSWSGSRAVGLGRARKLLEQEFREGTWYVYNAYTLKEFQGLGMGKRNLAFRLDEIRKRGGKEVIIDILSINNKMLHIAEEILGFKVASALREKLKRKFPIKGSIVELRLNLQDPKVIKKISEILDAR